MLFIGCAALSDLYLFQGIVLLNGYFKFSKNLILYFTDKVTIGIKGLVLFISNVTPIVDVAGTVRVGGLKAIAGVLDISNIMQPFKPYCIVIIIALVSSFISIIIPQTS